MKLCLSLCLLFFFGTSFAQNDERILDYHSDITVLKDGSMLVTETIKVQSQGDQIKRGIYRSFPVKYRDRFNNNVVVRFEVEEVLRDGSPEDYHIKKEGRLINVYIGNETNYLNPGTYTYELTYTTNRQLGFFEEFDELYWNAIGTEWDFPIDQSSATITLPEGAEILQHAAYSGPAGSKGCDCETNQLSRREIEFHLTTPLRAREGFTVSVAWPKGVVHQPTSNEKLNYFLNDNRGAFYGLAGLMLIFIYYLYAWLQVGKDPREGTFFPLYQPPNDLSPAAVRYVMEMGYDNMALAASIVNMAVNGYLKIKETDKYFYLNKLSEDDSMLSKGEKLLAKELFSSGKKLRLSNEKHKAIKGAVSALKSRLKTDVQHLHFKLNRKWMIPGYVLTALTLLAVFYTQRFEMNPAAIGIVAWLSIWSVGCVALASQTINAWRTASAGGKGSVGGAIFMTLFSIPFFIFEVAALIMLGFTLPFVVVLILILLAALNIWFYHLMEAPTVYGRKVMDEIEGFKMYLSTTEKDRLNLLSPPDQTPEHFEKLLPYAVALNVANEWGSQFEEVLKQAQSKGQSGYHPHWYSGDNWNKLGVANMANSFSSGFTSAVSSSSVAPGSSSGSGGGGSSGGGGGGGGGGGW